MAMRFGPSPAWPAFRYLAGVGVPLAVIDARRQRRPDALRPGEEYRDLSPAEWDEFLGHFELRKVELGGCARDFGTPCVHEHACIRCPALRPDPAQRHRLADILASLRARHQVTYLGLPDFRPSVGRSSGAGGGP